MRVRGGHRYHIYSTRRGRVSYYPYPWVPIDIPRYVVFFYNGVGGDALLIELCVIHESLIFVASNVIVTLFVRAIAWK